MLSPAGEADHLDGATPPNTLLCRVRAIHEVPALILPTRLNAALDLARGLWSEASDNSKAEPKQKD